MNELIDVFLENYFTEEFKDEVYRSFNLFDKYEYLDAYSEFVNIITDYNQSSTDDLKDKFVIELQTRLDYVLNEHTIKLVETTTIEEKNEILSALLLIQNLEDYSGIINTLESLESNEEQLAIILSDLCLLSDVKIMELVESFDSTILSKLKQFIYSKETDNQDIDEETQKTKLNITNNLKLFFELSGTNNLAYLLISSSIIVGELFETYLSYIEDDIVSKSDEQTAINILSMIYLSSNGYNAPLLTFRKYSYRLLPAKKVQCAFGGS